MPVRSPGNGCETKEGKEDAAFHLSYWDDDIPS